jgi:hypothetical protein
LVTGENIAIGNVYAIIKLLNGLDGIAALSGAFQTVGCASFQNFARDLDLWRGAGVEDGRLA